MILILMLGMVVMRIKIIIGDNDSNEIGVVLMSLRILVSSIILIIITGTATKMK